MKEQFFTWIVGSILFLVLVSSIFLSSGQGNYSLGILLYFVDIPSLFIIIIMNLFMLVVTKSVKLFLNSFSNAYNADKTHYEIKSSIRAVKLVMQTSIFGSISVSIIHMILLLRQLDSIESIGIYLALALLILLYAVLICLILLPIKNKLEIIMEQ